MFTWKENGKIFVGEGIYHLTFVVVNRTDGERVEDVTPACRWPLYGASACNFARFHLSVSCFCTCALALPDRRLGGAGRCVRAFQKEILSFA